MAAAAAAAARQDGSRPRGACYQSREGENNRLSTAARGAGEALTYGGMTQTERCPFETTDLLIVPDAPSGERDALGGGE